MSEEIYRLNCPLCGLRIRCACDKCTPFAIADSLAERLGINEHLAKEHSLKITLTAHHHSTHPEELITLAMSVAFQ